MKARYFARKIGWAIITVFFVLTFNFFLFRIMPGDPAGLLARSQKLTADQVAEQRKLFGLDDPLLTQYWKYLRETITGHLGTSYEGPSVVDLIGAALWPTILLVGVGTTIAVDRRSV